MALSINQFPASCSLAQSPIIFSVFESSNVIFSASFQYNADIFYWTGTPEESGSFKYRMVKYPNSADAGIFDFSKIINSTLIDVREENPSNVVYFAGEFYWTYASQSISEGTTTIVSGSRERSGTYQALDGYAIFQEPINQQISSKSEFWPLMTDGASTQSIFEENKGTIGVYTGVSDNLNANGVFYSSSLTSSLIELSSSISSSEQIQQIPAFPSETGFPITYADWYEICAVSASVSSSQQQTDTIVSASFHTEPLTQGEDRLTIDADEIFGPLLNNASDICFYDTVKPLFVVSTAKNPLFEFDGTETFCAEVEVVNCDTNIVAFASGYTVSSQGQNSTEELVFANTCDPDDNQFVSSSFVTVPTLVTTPISCIRFEEECKQKYPNVRIKWKNRYGQFDYFNFYMISRTSFSTSNRSYQPQLGSWEGSTLGYNNYDSGKLNYIVDSEQSLSVNTNWISEEYNDLLKQLLVSEEIYWVYDEENNDLRPITIATDSVVFLTGVVDKTIQYSFDFMWGQAYKLIL